ncbi:nucleosidase, partial [Acidithiobacillus ferrooxidans]|nr:nucleosidase [Acidithiobacillus ferrooxidans]
RLARGLLRHPAELSTLLGLGGQMQKALRTLRTVAPALRYAGKAA